MNRPLNIKYFLGGFVKNQFNPIPESTQSNYLTFHPDSSTSKYRIELIFLGAPQKNILNLMDDLNHLRGSCETRSVPHIDISARSVRALSVSTDLLIGYYVI